MQPARIGTATLGVVLVLVIGALAYPIIMQAPEFAEGDGPDGLPFPPVPDVDDGDGGDPQFQMPDPPPAGSYSVHLQAWAATGPHTEEPLPIDRRLFSTNIWLDNGWWPQRNDTWTQMLAAIQPGSLRWPSGHPSQSACFTTETGELWPGCNGWPLTRERLDQFIEVCRDVGAEPLIGINEKRGSPEMAAAIVHYLNVEKGYGVKYFQIGNEPDLGNNWAHVDELNAKWRSYSDAMRGVDSSIQLIGPEVMTGANAMGSNGRPDVMRAFLEQNGGTVDALSWHLYPLDSENPSPNSGAHPTIEHLLAYWAEDWHPSGVHFVDVIGEKLRRDRDELAPGAEIWVTELGPDSGEPGARGITDGQASAVWFADVLGRFGAAGTSAVFQFAYDHWDHDDELSLVKRQPYGNFDPLPPWYTYWLYAETWGDRVVKTNSTDDGNVSVHASLRPDGKLAAVLVNKAATDASARLTLNDFGGVASAEAYRITADSPTSLEASVNGKQVDPLRFEETAGAITPEAGPATPDGVWGLPPYSVTFVVFTPA